MAGARVLIIDEHEAVRQALEGCLQNVNGFEVVCCTGCGEEGVRQAVELDPDVVLLEIKRADGRGLDILRQLVKRAPGSSVVVLTSYPDGDERERAYQAGAASYVLKDIGSAQLVREIRAASHRRGGQEAPD